MDISIPAALQAGTLMTKVSAANKQKRVVFRIDADRGQILWTGKREKISPSHSFKLVFLFHLITLTNMSSSD
jgi:hypothetical protein